MRRTTPVLAAALAAVALSACAPQPAGGPGGTPATPAASGSLAGPGGTATPGGTPAPAAPAAPVADLATKFPLPKEEGFRQLTYKYHLVEPAATKDGTEYYKLSKCGDSGCTASANRAFDGKDEYRDQIQYPPMGAGAVMPYPYRDAKPDMDANAAKAKDETVTVPAGTFAAKKVSFGGAEAYEVWYQAPYVLKVVYKGQSRSSTMELQKIE